MQSVADASYSDSAQLQLPETACAPNAMANQARMQNSQLHFADCNAAPWPSSLKMSSRFSSDSFFPLRLFFPPFPAEGSSTKGGVS